MCLRRICAAPPRSEHPLILLLRDLNPDELSPLDALRLLMEWKKLWSDNPEALPQQANDDLADGASHE